MGRRVGLFALCVAIIAMIGCGGGTDTTQQLRVVMASPDAPPVDILIDGNQVGTALAYTNSTAYQSVKTGSHRVQALTVSNSTSVFQQNISLTAGANQTLLLTGAVAHIDSVLLTDGASTTTTINTSKGQVRVVNASPGMGAADVYILNVSSSISGAKPVASDLAVNQATAYQLETIGNFQVFMTQPGTTNVYLNSGPLALTQSQFLTVVAVNAVGGGFNYIVLTDQ